MMPSLQKKYVPYSDWRFQTIGEVTEKFMSGGTPSTKNPEYWTGNIPWTTSAPMTSFYLDHGECMISKEGLEKSASNLVPKNNVLISTRVGIGKVVVNRIDIAISQDITGVILDKTRIIPDFFVWTLLSRKYSLLLKGMSRGTTIKGLIRSELERFTIPLPPLPEQRRIAAILSTVDDALQRSRQAALETERLKAGVMQELMTKGIGHTEFREDPDVGWIPKEWGVKKLGEISDIVSGGTPSRNEAKFWNGNIPWIKTGEINYNIIYNTEEKITLEGFKNSAARLIPKDTLLMALYGQGVTRGRVAITGIEATINQACAAMLFTEKVETRFIFYFLTREYNSIRSLSGGANQNNLNIPLIKSVSIALPPITEQQKIATILSTIDCKLSLQRQRTAHYEKIRQGLMNDLLTGRKRVKVT